MGLYAGRDGPWNPMTNTSQLAQWIVQGFETKMRLQDALPLVSKDFITSKKGCKKAIQRGQVLLNGVAGQTGDWVANGDRIVLMQAEQIRPVNVPVPIHIGFEDQAILVVWKPAGLHTSGSHPTSLRAQVATQFQENRSVDTLGHPEPAHRLDFATSGWVAFGRTSGALQSLNLAFKQEQVKKSYLALVHGVFPDAVQIMLPIATKSASTWARCWARGTIPTHGEGSLLHITTGTGRTHQIRKHLHAIRHSIVGDDRYAKGQHYTGHGLLLCAYRIELKHPENGATIQLEAHLPRKFTRFRWVKNVVTPVHPQRLS